MTGERWLTLAVVSAGTAMLLLDVTVVNVALPVIADNLDASFDELQWVIDAYALTLAATLLTAGVLADRHGRRRVYAIGLALFTVFSALCGAATSGAVLDLARGAQGIGAAAMFAASLALLAHEFQGRERGFALGVWGAITGAALALGPLVGGILVDALSWRWVFLINLPIGVMLIWATLRRLPESRDPTPRGLDPAGLITFAGAAFLGTFGLIRGNVDGWGSLPVAGSLSAAVVLLVAFVIVERRGASPMLPPALFRIPAFTGTALVAFAQSFALYPLFLFLAIYLQGVLGYSPTGTGLRMLPLTLVLFVVAPLSGKLTGRVRLRVHLVAGLLLIAASLLLMRGIDPSSDWTALLPGFVVGGLAIGVISPALAAAMVGVLSVEQSGLASGVNNTFRQLGIAVGIGVLGAIFQHHVGVGEPQRADDVVDALNAIFIVAAAVAVAGAVAAWPLLGRLRSTPADGEEEASARPPLAQRVPSAG
jgi:EmrB/QacA subfamily drug resistance transporter